ncbi:aldehyde dehydrogenase [Streptomyces abyssomicinicus]|uniref:aldehyde dehydrogenase n=1 Tax=Streptomyces abyssomicinicus TaxID=574929 RepID=UPI00124F9840|nr:aldehyde dehydrogenase [Streptomyces abyssomicinicus]
MSEVRIKDKIFIGGAFVDPATDHTLDVVSPVTEEVVARVPEARPEDIDRAVAAARRAFDEGPWPRMALPERIAVLRRFRECYAARMQEVGAQLSREVGSPITWSVRAQAGAPLGALDYYLTMAPDFAWEREEQGIVGPVVVRHEPVGVVAAIVAWNAPYFIGMNKLAPALVAGCTAILKVSPENALSSYILAEAAAEAELPEGVLSVLVADRGPSAHLSRHPGIDKIGFTGSVAGGQAVMAAAAANLTRVTLELGGKSAAIVMEDADLDEVLPALAPHLIPNNGQVCVSMTRVLVQRSRYDEVVEKLATLFRGWRVGDPLDPETVVGPLVSRRQRDRVESYIARGISEGARLVTGGGRPTGLDRGWYVEPTLFADVDNSMTIAREEIFGPVVVVIPFEDDDDAVRIANDSDYGLSGSVWGADHARARGIADRMRTGNVGINGHGASFNIPFGGYKKSGIGRELGPEGLKAFLEIKAILNGARH